MQILVLAILACTLGIAVVLPVALILLAPKRRPTPREQEQAAMWEVMYPHDPLWPR
jgi:hypothetical protein